MTENAESAAAAGRAQKTIVHLVRHGEVANPDGILYGRIPGFRLSEDGQMMAKNAADFLAGRDITLLRSSPLERWNHFEGLNVGVGDGSLRAPRHWYYLRNPFRPSWGEPYKEVAARVLAAAAGAAAAARGHEAVCVSHQLPIWVARRSAEGRTLWHDPRRRQCALGSVTSLAYEGDRRLAFLPNRTARQERESPARSLYRARSVPGGAAVSPVNLVLHNGLRTTACRRPPCDPPAKRRSCCCRTGWCRPRGVGRPGAGGPCAGGCVAGGCVAGERGGARADLVLGRRYRGQQSGEQLAELRLGKLQQHLLPSWLPARRSGRRRVDADGEQVQAGSRSRQRGRAQLLGVLVRAVPARGPGSGRARDPFQGRSGQVRRRRRP